ncbi:BTB/POZ domain-containing protein FBL11 isoform X2 [Vitis vinifera]|uniref:BTB/POZ domain-containing protein FBL11 isoform X2 n=1 Tax=Vitis vinifera TaxID=29760 RepID=UPI00053FE8E1|nr:BTB/POZ domain-containing protein FBL11 isoform X2 [Vitis vinifera]|eukprot:XP_010654061.1 PREDICTED: BTB/POZ domain-containing protein FBL11 isoform X2 [Vitis vinifera]
MASNEEGDVIFLVCTNPNSIEEPIAEDEIYISTAETSSWDLPTILSHRIVKVQSNRNRLIQHSSYFHSLLCGNFRKSCHGSISIQWNLEAFINILKFIYGCPLDVTPQNFIPLYEGALFFGVDTLLLKCKIWFSELISSKGPLSLQIQLDDLIHIWDFGLEHANDFIPELCTMYLARNFMWAMSCNSYGNLPYNMLIACTRHPELTVDSEKHLSDALLVWLAANPELSECSSCLEDDCTDVLKQKVDISGCPQITVELLLLSVIPCSYIMDSKLRKSIEQSLINLKHLDRKQYAISPGLLPILTFEAVQDVDISKCSRLHFEAAIECFCKSFPALRTLRAAYLLNIKMTSLRQLVKCSLLSEVDLTVDVSPVIPMQVSIISSSQTITPKISTTFVQSENYILDATSFSLSGSLLSNITNLTLEGRTDVSDSDLQDISEFCVSLCYLNLKACTSVTDTGMSILIRRCIKLQSILVCDTSFGRNSILALCCSLPNSGNSVAVDFGNKQQNSVALKLQTLHMGGCKGVDETSLLEVLSQVQVLRSLCLRETHLVDNALCSFSGSSLEMLDVDNTMVSGAALAYVVRGNPGLKCLKARGCKNLFQQGSNGKGEECSSFSHSCKELYLELAKTCKLEEFSFGWGFSHFSLEALGPAITSLKKINMGLGASLSHDALTLLPTTCPFLESVILYFQVITDSIMINIMQSLRYLQVLVLCYCLGDISSLSFKFSMPNLRKLRLERVTPWMTNDELAILTQNCVNLVELSLLGCRLLNSDSQQIISCGWPGLTSIHLEECGEVTADGVISLFDCKALEDLLLRHNGPGIQRNFILDAASKMPMLRKVSLDLCDASEGDFDLPNYADRYSLSIVKIARCKFRKCTLELQILDATRRPVHMERPVHKETLVLVWSSKNLTRTVVKERI